MRELFGWTIGYTKSGGPKLEYQVAVAIGAVLCATFFCNAYVAPGKPPSQPAPVVAPGARADLLKANFTDDGFRSRPASAVEFAAVYGHADRSYTALAAQWSLPSPGPSKAEGAPVAKAQKKATVLAQACSVDCVTPSLLSAAVVPPRRPADLASAPIALAAAPAAAEEKRVRLLGVSLPGFVPSRDTIAKTVVSWGGSIVDAIPGL